MCACMLSRSVASDSKGHVNESHCLSHRFMGDCHTHLHVKIVCCDLIITDLIT